MKPKTLGKNYSIINCEDKGLVVENIDIDIEIYLIFILIFIFCFTLFGVSFVLVHNSMKDEQYKEYEIMKDSLRIEEIKLKKLYKKE